MMVNCFSSANFSCVEDFSDIRMTVDEPRDFDLISKLIEDLGTKESWLTYTRHIISNQYNKINSNIIRNEGMLKSLKDDNLNG
jgi:spore coat polysaccharide biosynthesis protein SpsF